MLTAYTGQIYALLTAVCWAGSAVCFEAAGRRVGSLATNLWRICIAVVLLAGVNWVWLGRPIPTDAPQRAWVLLGLSGAIGFFLGDLALFRAFLLIGARRSTLIMSLAPAMAAVLAYFVLGQRVHEWGIVGMALTLAGIFWVISERTPGHADVSPHAPAETRRGVTLALIGALGQAVGLILAKMAEVLPGGGTIEPIAATFIRAAAGAACFIGLAPAIGFVPTILRATRDARAMTEIALGAVIGPVMGVTFLLASMHTLSPGIAQTFAATVPVLMLPIAAWQGREKITWRAAFGAGVAVGGVVVLCRA